MDENIGFSYENLSFNMNDRAWLKCPCKEKNKEKTCLSENQCFVKISIPVIAAEFFFAETN